MTNENDTSIENETENGELLAVDDESFEVSVVEPAEEDILRADDSDDSGGQPEDPAADGKAPVKASEADGKKPAKAKEPKVEAPPAWIAFVAGVKDQLKAEGLEPEVKEQKGFVQFKNLATGHRLYIAKQGRGVGKVETTIDLVGILDGAKLPEKENGRIACTVDPSLPTVVEALRLLMTEEEKIRPPKRVPKAAAPAPK